jgi:hypothetical protein
MKHTPLTKKQAKAQVWASLFQGVYGLYWLVMGIEDKSWTYLIMGFVFLALVLGMLFYILWVRKHYPIDDPKADQILAENQKAGRTGFLIISGIITAGFLIAFGIAWALS